MLNPLSTKNTGTYLLPISALLSVIAGVSLWLAAPPRGLWPAALVGIACLWAVVRYAHMRSAFGWGFVAGFTYFYLLFDWAQVAAEMVLSRVALAAIEALFFGVLALLWAGIWRWEKRRASAFAVALALVGSGAAWAGIEELRSSVPFGGLPWGLLGYTLVDSPLAHLAPLGSTELVGAVAVIGAIAAALAVRNALHVHLLRAVLAGLVTVVAVCAPLSVPLTFAQPSEHLPFTEVRAAIVQGNAPRIGTVAAADWSPIVTANHVQAARQLLSQKPELILLPESTSEIDYRTDESARAALTGLAQDAGVPLMLGTQYYYQESEDWLRTNDYVVQYPNGQLPKASDTYSKQHPVPFGEYIPLRSMLSGLAPKLKDISVDMVPGKKPAQLAVKLARGEVRVVVPICFEVAYAGIVSAGITGSATPAALPTFGQAAPESALAPASLLVVPTSNVTFGDSDEAAQQFQITRFRAIENARTAVQVSTMGVSGVARPDGSVVYHTQLFQQDARVLSLPLYDSVTPAAATYSERVIVTYILLALCAVWAVAGWRHQQR